jgi:hypothetical protein
MIICLLLEYLTGFLFDEYFSLRLIDSISLKWDRLKRKLFDWELKIFMLISSGFFYQS